MHIALLSAALWFAYFGVPGSFRGVVVRGPDHQPGWIYVAGRNDSLRKVEVTRAVVSYDQEVPTRLRARAPEKEIVEGAEIRVTGEPDSQGEWHATEISILRVSPKKKKRPDTAARVQSHPL